MIRPGQKAPDFALFDTEKKKISLSDYRGRNLLILFFPLAYTSVCTAELCSIRDNMSRYNSLDTDVIGICVDSLFTLKKFREDEKINFPLLSDFNREISALYGSIYDVFAFDMKGVSKRSAFLIDREGIVRYAEILDNAGELPSFEAIKRTLLTFA